MTEEKKNIPKLRFPEFKNAPAWEQRKFDDLANYKKGPFGSSITKDMFVPKSEESIKVYEQQNAINKDWSLSRYFLPKDYVFTKLKSFEVRGGDIIVSCAGTIGEIYEIPKNADYGVINQALMRIRVNEEIVDKKIFAIEFSNMIDNFTKTYSNGSAIKNIPPFADLKSMEVSIPSICEQKNISVFFEQLDTHITYHQRKLDKLKERKKALLQRMFPKDGQTIPELRFPGFTDAWEQRKLGEIVTYKNGKGHENNQSDQGKYELINLNSISIDGGLKSSGKYIDNEGDILLENDLVMILSDVGHGDLLGRVAIIPENDKFILNQRVALLRINDDTNPYFLFYIINRHQKYFKKSGAGSSQLNISRGTVEDFIVDFPCAEEQLVIANLLKKIDTHIACQQRMLEHLKLRKKALLQQMFV